MAQIPKAQAATFPGVNGMIAFTSNREGDNANIFVMNPDGSGQTMLTTDPQTDSNPAWSADGTKIAFESGREINFQIFVMNADGSGQINLSNNDESDFGPSWSPDGTKLAFTSPRDGNWEIYVMNSDGTGQSKLTDINDEDIDSTNPSWSPDGTKIAFDSDRDDNNEIYVMNADGSGVIRLTDNSVFDNAPSWSPDGTKIVFNRVELGNPEVYVMNADGTGQMNLSNNPNPDQQASWSPDGTKIAFSTNRDGNDEIYVMNADGTGQMNISNNPAGDGDPDWQPLALPDECSNENVLLADAGVISLGGTTDLTQRIDTCGDLTGVIKSWTVLEADGDTCKADDLPAIIPPSGEVTREYPTEFSILTAAGDGKCDTADIGIYTSETQVEINGVVQAFKHEFETNFFVIPESPIGSAVLLASSLAALAGFAYFRHHRLSLK